MRKERVACYIRVSSEEQKLHGISLDAQEDKLRTYAQKNNLDIVAWYRDEGISGRKLIKNRPALQQMIKDKDNFDRILFIKLDRFFRSVAEYHEAMKLLDPVIWTATEERYDLTSANGRVFVNMKLSISEYEADQTGDRIRLVNEYKVKNGLALTGSVPLGFKIVKADNGRRIVKDPEKEPELRWILKEYARTLSARAVSFKFEEVWGYHRGEKSIRMLIKNTMLYGSYRGNDNYCEPYITKQEWLSLNSHWKNPVRTSPRPYLFSSILKCPVCGGNLTGRENNYNKIYYSCKRHYNRRCTYAGQVSEIKIEQMLLENMEALLHDAKVSVAPRKKTVKRDYKAELERLNYSWQKGRISVEDYDKQYDELMALISKQEETSYEVDFSAIERVLSKGWRNIYSQLDNAHKSQFWHSILKEMHITWESYGNKSIDEVLFL